MSVWALLVAAGTGERLGEERPKAFVGLGELPLLAEPLRRLDESDWVDAIVVAAPHDWEEPAILLAEELSATKVVAAVTGGATRAESPCAPPSPRCRTTRSSCSCTTRPGRSSTTT